MKKLRFASWTETAKVMEWMVVHGEKFEYTGEHADMGHWAYEIVHGMEFEAYAAFVRFLQSRCIGARCV